MAVFYRNVEPENILINEIYDNKIFKRLKKERHLLGVLYDYFTKVHQITDSTVYNEQCLKYKISDTIKSIFDKFCWSDNKVFEDEIMLKDMIFDFAKKVQNKNMKNNETCELLYLKKNNTFCRGMYVSCINEHMESAMGYWSYEYVHVKVVLIGKLIMFD